MTVVDLNADLGEGMPWDRELLGLVTSANVSCGAHAGDRESIAATLLEAGRRGVAVGAHPSWPDREGFGRVERTATRGEVAAIVSGQLKAFLEMSAGAGVAVAYVKPHGALYNQAMRDDPGSAPIREGLLDAILPHRLAILGLPGTALGRASLASGLSYFAEGFPDRTYTADGRLVPRSQPGSKIEPAGEVASQALRLVAAGIRSLCIHGDAPGAVERASAIVATLKAAGVALAPFASTSGLGR